MEENVMGFQEVLERVLKEELVGHGVDKVGTNTEPKKSYRVDIDIDIYRTIREYERSI